MPWVKIDEGFPEHPKMRAVGPLGRELFVAALCHCNRYLTDGRLSLTDLRRLGQYQDLYVDAPDTLPGLYEHPSVDELAEALVAVGAMHWRDGYFFVHEYGDFQKTKARVLAEREVWRDRKRRQRAPKSASVAGGSSLQVLVSPRESGSGRTTTTKDLEPEDVHARARDFHFEALAEVCGLDTGSLTKGDRGRLNRALADLREVGATPEEIRRRADIYRRTFDAALTPTALSNNWSICANEQPRRNGRRGVTATELVARARETAEREAREALPS